MSALKDKHSNSVKLTQVKKVTVLVIDSHWITYSATNRNKVRESNFENISDIFWITILGDYNRNKLYCFVPEAEAEGLENVNAKSFENQYWPNLKTWVV